MVQASKMTGVVSKKLPTLREHESKPEFLRVVVDPIEEHPSGEDDSGETNDS